MELQIIKTEGEYQELLDWVDGQFDLNITPDSREGQRLQIALSLIKQYEDLNYPIPFKGRINTVKKETNIEDAKSPGKKSLIDFYGKLKGAFGDGLEYQQEIRD